jgi:GTPase SAR1 family protein
MAIDPKSREFFLRSDYAVWFGILSGACALILPTTQGWLMLASAPFAIYTAGALLSAIVIGIVRLRSVFGFVFLRLRYHCCKCHAVGEPHFKCRCCKEMLGEVYPSSLGGFEVSCTCGVKIPTLNMNGRLKKAIKVCRECGAEMLSQSTGRVPEYVIAIAGPVSSGKSTLFTAMLQSLERTISAKSNINVQFEDEDQEVEFRGAISKLVTKRKLAATKTFRPEAVSVSLARSRRRLALLHFVDTRGEDYDSSSRITELVYHGQLDAAVFALDILAEKAFLQKRNISAVSVAKASATNRSSIEILENFVRGLEANGFGVNRKFDVSLAVVITKCDVFTESLDQIAGSPAQHLLRDAGLDDFVKMANERFQRVRFFPVSVTQSGEADQLEYNPIGVEHPTQFLLDQCKALTSAKNVRRLFSNAMRSLIRSARGQEGDAAWGLAISIVCFAVIFSALLAGAVWGAVGVCVGGILSSVLVFLILSK